MQVSKSKIIDVRENEDCSKRFTDVLHLYSLLPIPVRYQCFGYLYTFATNVLATYTLSLPGIFTTQHNYRPPDEGEIYQDNIKVKWGRSDNLIFIFCML